MKIILYSFSYHKDQERSYTLPNMGGHEFDCRGLPNPGLEESFKNYSGLSQKCKEYFRKLPEAEKLVRLCHDFIQFSVELCQKKEYELLTVGFGCTGGQHRSVYCSNSVFNLLGTSKNIELELLHLRLPQLVNIIE
jgi:RNase adapter protein RapZ